MHKNFYWSSFITVAVNHLISYYSLFLNLSRSDVQIQKLNLHIFSRNFVLLKINPRNTSQNYPRKNKPSQKMIKKVTLKRWLFKLNLNSLVQVKSRPDSFKLNQNLHQELSVLISNINVMKVVGLKHLYQDDCCNFSYSMLIKGFRYLALRILSDFLFEVRW